MKNILILTDFSPESHYALDVALLLAQCTGGRLLLLHSFVRPTAAHTSCTNEQQPPQVPVLESREAVKRRLHGLADQARQQAPHIPVHVLLATTTLDNAVPKTIREHDVDLLVLGAHQNTSWGHFFLSLHTEQIMRDASCPVLVVRHPVNGFDLHHLVFASDFSAEADEAAPILHQLLELFPAANLHLLDMLPSAGHSDHALAAIHALARRHKFHPYESDVLDAPRPDNDMPRFAEQDYPNLVLMLTHGRSALGQLLAGRFSAKAVRHAVAPFPKIPF